MFDLCNMFICFLKGLNVHMFICECMGFANMTKLQNVENVVNVIIIVNHTYFTSKHHHIYIMSFYILKHIDFALT